MGVLEVKMEWLMSYLPPSSTPDIITPVKQSRTYCDIDTGILFHLAVDLFLPQAPTITSVVDILP